MIISLISKIRKTFAIQALSDRIYYTLTMSLIVRAGFHLPIPGISLGNIKDIASSNGFLGFMNMLSGGALSQASVFALGISPYITASIMFYVLTLAYPRLEQMQKDGGKERDKLTQWTRYLSIFISIFQSGFVIAFLQSRNLIEEPSLLFYVNTTLILTTSVVFLTWLGDQMTTHGIGNGISIIIFIGIVSRLPSGLYQFVELNRDNKFFFLLSMSVLTFTLLLTAAIIIFQLAQRKVPIYYAASRGSATSSRSYLPIKMNSAGVMPIIFAGTLQSGFISLVGYLPEAWKFNLQSYIYFDSPLMLGLYFILVLFFTFFYTSVVFDPEKISENLKKSGGSIHGIRPGKETIDYLENIILRITTGGAFFLALIAVLPFVMNRVFGAYFSIGGTSILIAVGVAIEVLQQIESALSMEDYKGFV